MALPRPATNRVPSWLSATWVSALGPHHRVRCRVQFPKLVFDCDVASDEQIARMFADLSADLAQVRRGLCTALVAPREAIAGNFLDGLSARTFRIAHDISAYSFPAMAKAALPYLNDKSSLLTLSYLGALRSIPNYTHGPGWRPAWKPACATLAEAVGRT